MNSGAPHGSILGPLLFICYINGFPPILKKSMAFLYPDDTAILMKGKNVSDITRDLNTEMRVLERWFIANTLAVNTTKTKCSNRFKDKFEPLNVAQNASCG